MDESTLHHTIIRTINDFYDCSDEIAGILRRNTASVLGGLSYNEICDLEARLAEIDKERTACIEAITSGAVSEDDLDDKFQQLYEEEECLTKRLDALKSERRNDTSTQLESAVQEIENTQFRVEHYDDILVRKLIECIRVMDPEHIQIIFKGGAEVVAELEA